MHVNISCIWIFCMYVCVTHSWLVPQEVRRVCQILWIWSSWWLWANMWVHGLELRPYGRAASTSNHWASSPAPRFLIARTPIRSLSMAMLKVLPSTESYCFTLIIFCNQLWAILHNTNLPVSWQGAICLHRQHPESCGEYMGSLEPAWSTHRVPGRPTLQLWNELLLSKTGNVLKQRLKERN